MRSVKDGRWTNACLLFAVLLAITGCSDPVSSSNPSRMHAWVNPGAPAAPGAIAGDWFDRASRDASAVLSASGLPPEKGYVALMRAKNGATLRGSSVVVQPAADIEKGQAFAGYTLCYADRIELVVTPADAPFDVDAQLASTDMTTTTGATRLWRRTSIRGKDAAMRPCAVQQWESGAVNHMPAALEWSEPTGTDAGPTYIHYALLGDDVSALRAAAVELAALE